MESYPFISVIVPVFQAEDYIEACLKSIISQDYLGKIECILIDDCSKDSSMLKARHFIDTYNGEISFKIYSSGCTKGASSARNIGICHASGDYIFLWIVMIVSLQMLLVRLRRHYYLSDMIW